MSFIFSRALVEASLQASCSGVDAFAPLSVIPTPKRSSSQGRTTEHLRLSRFGMTFELLTDEHGAELLTLWLEDFPARTSASQVAETVWTESGPVSGPKWRGSFAKYDQAESKWKTHQCSLLGDWDEFLETWPRWGSMRNGESFLRQTWTPPIFENGSGSLPIYPTPCTVDTGSFFNRSSSPHATKRPTLGAMAKHNLWPTPTVCGNYNRKGASKTSGDGLATAVRFRTPNASDGFKWSNQTEAERVAKGQQVRLCHQLGAGGQLNPEWVEWLMGWPIGHTALEPLATARYHEWLQQHGKS